MLGSVPIDPMQLPFETVRFHAPRRKYLYFIWKVFLLKEFNTARVGFNSVHICSLLLGNEMCCTDSISL